MEVVRTEVLVGEGVGGTLGGLHQQGGGSGGRGGGQLSWFLFEFRALDESPLDWRIVLLIRLLLDHADVVAGAGVAGLALRLLSLLWSVLVVRVLHLVEQSQLLSLSPVRSSLLLRQSLPLFPQVLAERHVSEDGEDKELLESQQLSLRCRLA